MVFRNKQFHIGDLVQYKYPLNKAESSVGIIVEDKFCSLGKAEVLWANTNSKRVEWTDDLEVVLAYN